ncbi:MAG: hypothetical protein AAGK79_16015 [Pseudomonadota bacterium]
MITRILGGLAGTVFAGLTVLGITVLIASDFETLGPKIYRLYAWTQAVPKPVMPKLNLGKAQQLADADSITFFHKQPIKGSDLEVSTGIAFASLEDVVAGRTINRWCYIQVKSGSHFTQKIDLGSQRGTARPKYTDTTVFRDDQLKGIDFSREELAKLARSHCLLKGFNPRLIGKQQSSAKPKAIPRRSRVFRDARLDGSADNAL